MFVDASALVAILREEPESDRLLEKVNNTFDCKISAASYLETSIVIDASRDPIASRRVDEFIADAGISIEPVTEAQARIAREAYRDFGKGSEHPAQLNFGDCFAYALAKDKNEPLLFKAISWLRWGSPPEL